MSSPASSDRISPQLIGAITATAILAFLGLFLETVLNVLFPALMSDFSVTMADVQWMTSGYLLVVSIVMPITGWLQRRFTPRSLFLTAAGSILTGALIAALAPTYPVLLAGRLVQGMGTGIVTPLMFTIILTRSPRSKIGALMGVGALVLAHGVLDLRGARSCVRMRRLGLHHRRSSIACLARYRAGCPHRANVRRPRPRC